MRDQRDCTVLVVGDAFCDVNAGPLPGLPQWGCNVISPGAIAAMPGGGALNVACGLQRLRGSTALFTGIGRDAFGDMLRRHCAEVGVNLVEARGNGSEAGGIVTRTSGRSEGCA